MVFFIRNGYDSDLSLGNVLLNLYAKRGSVKTAAGLFMKMPWSREWTPYSKLQASWASSGERDCLHPKKRSGSWVEVQDLKNMRTGSSGSSSSSNTCNSSGSREAEKGKRTEEREREEKWVN